MPCDPDIERHIDAVQEFADAGADELYIQQIGHDEEEFFEVYSGDDLPKFA